jgi:probable F420-dependent oxidoreductase
MVRMAQAAERAGFDSVWAGEHPFLSEKQSRMPPTLRMLDSVVALAFIAARTRTIRLGTGIILLPQFNPIILAKELASLDVLSGGRLIFGIGVGWSEHEYAALGLSYQNRGKRADEYLKAIKVIWNEDKPAYHGRYVSFDSLQAYPHPVQKPNPPIVVGGNSDRAYRRAIEQGNGWFGYGLDLEETKRSVAGLREAANHSSRPVALGELEISVAPRVPVDRATVQQFSELGVHRLILIPPQNLDTPGLERFIETAGSTLV